jgi:hypothetical protein
MIVKAKTGLQVPFENNHRRYISDDVTVDVPDTAYYRRRIAAGELVVQDGGTPFDTHFAE